MRFLSENCFKVNPIPNYFQFRTVHWKITDVFTEVEKTVFLCKTYFNNNFQKSSFIKDVAIVNDISWISKTEAGLSLGIKPEPALSPVNQHTQTRLLEGTKPQKSHPSECIIVDWLAYSWLCVHRLFLRDSVFVQNNKSIILQNEIWDIQGQSESLYRA